MKVNDAVQYEPQYTGMRGAVSGKLLICLAVTWCPSMVRSTSSGSAVAAAPARGTSRTRWRHPGGKMGGLTGAGIPSTQSCLKKLGWLKFFLG